MTFSVIICTYMRAEPLRKLLESVSGQTLYPNEILIVDGSLNNETSAMLAGNAFDKLQYFLVREENRGLTRQRNFGISKVGEGIEIVCFLDDDTVLNPDYFAELINTYAIYPDALGVGGYIINENKWAAIPENYQYNSNDFVFDGWKRRDGSRYVLRKKLGLDADTNPGFLPEFSNGRSIGFLPPSGKVYEVQQLMGGVSSFPKTVFKTFRFSEYFDGYGLYEDADFTLRLSKSGKLYINTRAQLNHYHDYSGRPNQYKYGKMVLRNGWYVWRVKYPNPSLKSRLKWHAVVLLLTVVRFTNVFTTSERKEALSETLGRTAGWLGLFFNKPR